MYMRGRGGEGTDLKYEFGLSLPTKVRRLYARYKLYHLV